MGGLWRVSKAFLARLDRDELPAYASALTYSLLFALFPLALALAGAARALHLAPAQQGLVSALSAVVPPEVLRLALQPHAAGGLPARTLAVAGAAGYLWGMSSAFRRLIDAFNHAYEYRPPMRRAAWWTLLLSGVLALTLGVGLVAAMVVATVGQSLATVLFPAAAGPALRALGGLVLLALALVMLAVLYWVGPDRPQRFRLFTPGALAAIGVWLGISFGFSLYLAHFNSYDILYGGVGAVILLLLYLYFLSYALLIGAEINAMVDARKAGDSRAPR